MLEKKRKILFSADIATVILLFAAAVYSAVFSLTLFPDILLENNSVQTDSLVGIMGVGLALGLGTAVAMIIMFIYSLICLIAPILALITALRAKRASKAAGTMKRWPVLRIVTSILGFIMTFTMTSWAVSIGPEFIPAPILSALGTLILILFPLFLKPDTDQI